MKKSIFNFRFDLMYYSWLQRLCFGVSVGLDGLEKKKRRRVVTQPQREAWNRFKMKCEPEKCPKTELCAACTLKQTLKDKSGDIICYHKTKNNCLQTDISQTTEDTSVNLRVLLGNTFLH